MALLCPPPTRLPLPLSIHLPLLPRGHSTSALRRFWLGLLSPASVLCSLSSPHFASSFLSFLHSCILSRAPSFLLFSPWEGDNDNCSYRPCLSLFSSRYLFLRCHTPSAFFFFNSVDISLVFVHISSFRVCFSLSSLLPRTPTSSLRPSYSACGTWTSSFNLLLPVFLYYTLTLPFFAFVSFCSSFGLVSISSTLSCVEF
jgi:hypothetical protein